MKKIANFIAPVAIAVFVVGAIAIATRAESTSTVAPDQYDELCNTMLQTMQRVIDEREDTIRKLKKENDMLRNELEGGEA